MKSMEEIKRILKEHKGGIREKYGVNIIGIFGSYVGIKVDLLTIKAVKQKPMLWKSIRKDLTYV